MKNSLNYSFLRVIKYETIFFSESQEKKNDRKNECVMMYGLLFMISMFLGRCINIETYSTILNDKLSLTGGIVCIHFVCY